MNAIETPRQARRFLNQAEAWFRRNMNRFGPTDQVVLRGMFEFAHTSCHAQELREELVCRVKSEPLKPMAEATTRNV